MRVFITGGTGLIGSQLVRRLSARGDQAVVLSRRAESANPTAGEMVQGDPTQAGPWQDVAAECDAIINLAGEGIFKQRWSEEFKKVLLDSRVQSTQNCVAALLRQPRRGNDMPKVLINASAVGIYGPHGDEQVDEMTPPGSDFLSGVCEQWEKATAPAEAAGVRVVRCRIGIVLDPSGGALQKMLVPFKMFMGGPIASGKQYMPWIHRDDVVGMLLFALDTPAASGPMNACAPHPVTNKEFGKALGRVLGRPAFLWTPGFLLRIGLGERADLVTTGQKAIPKKAMEWGYRFQFPDIDAALADVLK